MIRLRVGRHAAVAGMAATVLAGCSGTHSATSGMLPAAAAFAGDTTGPPACKGQRTTKKYGEASATLRKGGGSLCIPAFGGFGGSLQYPGIERSAKLTLRTSTENIYNEPQLGTGASLVYLNLHFHAGTHFGSHLKSAGGLTSESVTPGQAYTAYGIVTVGHLALMFPPCYAVATAGTYGGVLADLGHILRDTTITGAGYGAIEIYSGEQVSQAC